MVQRTILCITMESSWPTKAQIDVLFFSPWPYEFHFFPTDHIILCNTEIIGLLEISIIILAINWLLNKNR